MNTDHDFNVMGYCDRCALKVEWSYGRKCYMGIPIKSRLYPEQFYESSPETLPSVGGSEASEVAVPNNQGVDHHE